MTPSPHRPNNRPRPSFVTCEEENLAEGTNQVSEVTREGAAFPLRSPLRDRARVPIGVGCRVQEPCTAQRSEHGVRSRERRLPASNRAPAVIQRSRLPVDRRGPHGCWAALWSAHRRLPDAPRLPVCLDDVAPESEVAEAKWEPAERDGREASFSEGSNELSLLVEVRPPPAADEWPREPVPPGDEQREGTALRRERSPPSPALRRARGKYSSMEADTMRS